MPYTVSSETRDGKKVYCVYKADADGNPIGKSFGCHPTPKQAGAQIGAIEHAEKKELVVEVQLDEKAVTKSEGGCNHPSSHYLVVEDPSKPTTWHLRFKDCEGKVDHNLMGGAWAALHGGHRGRKYEGPQKAAALAKLKRLYGSENIPVPGEKKEFDGLSCAGTQSGFKVLPNGKWLGWWTNAFQDREEELFYTDSIKEFIDYWDKMKEALPLYWWHIPYDLGTTEWLGLAGRIAMAAGTLTKEGERFASYYAAHPEIELGMSHKFKWDANLTDGEGGYKWFRTKELTFLPKGKAANPFTTFEGVNMNEEKKEALAAIIGAEEAERRITETEAKSKELEENVKFKEEPKPEEPKAEEKPVEAPKVEEVKPEVKEAPGELVFGDDVLNAIADRVIAKLEPIVAKLSEGFKPALDAQAKELHDSLAVLLQKDEEKAKALLERYPKQEIYRASIKGAEGPLPVAIPEPKPKSPAEILAGNLKDSVAEILSARGV